MARARREELVVGVLRVQRWGVTALVVAALPPAVGHVQPLQVVKACDSGPGQGLSSPAPKVPIAGVVLQGPYERAAEAER